jgi:hypothetical protein
MTSIDNAATAIRSAINPMNSAAESGNRDACVSARGADISGMEKVLSVCLAGEDVLERVQARPLRKLKIGNAGAKPKAESCPDGDD